MLTRKPQRVPRKTLVLDLDETLIHSTSRPMPMSGSSGFFGFGRRNNGPGHTVEVILGGKRTVYHVYKRPFADFFLRTVRLSLLCLSISYNVVRRYQVGTHWLSSRHPCKSMQILSLTG